MKRTYLEIDNDYMLPQQKKPCIKKETIIDALNSHLDLGLSNSWSISGPTGCGKSYLADKFITQYRCKERYYFSPTPEKISFWVTTHYNHKELQNDIIEGLISKQKKFDTDKTPRIQIIINDYASCLNEKSIKKTLIDLATTGRHYKIDLIILTQYFTSIPPAVRQNIRNSIYFGPCNKNELRNITMYSHKTPTKTLGFFIESLNKHEYILEFPSKNSGKFIFIKCKDLDIIEKISDF